MATLKESVGKIASALGGQKGSTAVTNDRHYKELRDLVSQVGGKITLRNSDLEERGGEQNHHDYLYEVELDQRSALRFRGARCFDGSREVADFNYNKLSEKQKESLTADIRDRLSMYAHSAISAREEAIEAIRERLVTPDVKALTTEESYVIDRYLYYNRSIGGSDSEVTKLTDEAISKAGQNITPERIEEVRAELRDFKPEIKYHYDLWNWQVKGLTEEPHFGDEQEHEMSFAEARELAKKYNKLDEFDQMRENGWDDPVAMLAELDLPIVIDGQEYRASHGPLYESSAEMEMVDFGGDKAMNEKFEELVSIAKQHATGKGLQTGIKWLEESFNEFLAMSDKAPGWGQGGQPGSQFNREVLAGKVIQHFDGVGGDHELSEEQLSRLKESLSSIANEKIQNGLKI